MQLAQSYPAKLVCQVLGVPRSSFYYQPQSAVGGELPERIRQLCAAWPTYGYRRISAQLAREGSATTLKQVRQLMGQMSLLAKPNVRKKPTTNSQHPFPRYPNLMAGQVVQQPEQVWVADITYIRLADGFAYLALLMDVYTRSIRGWHLGRSLGASLTLTALRKALAERRPQIHHSDQGVQYAALEYVETLRAAGVRISMAPVGEAWQNGYAERLVRTIKEEEVDLAGYGNYQEAYSQIGHFIEQVYMHKRIHSALGYLTPAEFEQQHLGHAGRP